MGKYFPESSIFNAVCQSEPFRQRKRNGIRAFLQAASTAKKEGIEFSENERDLMINILKQNMSEEKRKKTEMILSLMKNMKRR